MIYNQRLIEKIMRYFLLIGNIDKINLYVAGIKVYLCCLSCHIGQKHFNVLESALYI